MIQKISKLILFSRSLNQIAARSLCIFCGLTMPLQLHSADKNSNIFQSQPVQITKARKSWQMSPAKHIPVDSQIQRTSNQQDQPKSSENHSQSTPLKADAGDDVLAFVGRKATLNGGQSQPVGNIGIRWIQISGPQITEAFTQGPNLIVVPPVQGVYQFLLVVAQGSEISDPDHVTLTAVAIPKELQSPVIQDGFNSAKPNPESSQNVAPAADLPVEDLLAKLAFQSLSGISHNPSTSHALSVLFSDIAGKMDLYASYSEINEEMSRRIDLILKDSGHDLQVWSVQVFEPLTTALSIWVKPSGLDLRNQAQWHSNLNSQQRQRLSAGLTALAKGFQAVEPGSNIQSGNTVIPDIPKTVNRQLNEIQK